jgi:uncharacterized protein
MGKIGRLIQSLRGRPAIAADQQPAEPAPAAPPPSKGWIARLTDRFMEDTRVGPAGAFDQPYRIPDCAPGVRPERAPKLTMAMDSGSQGVVPAALSWAAGAYAAGPFGYHGTWAEGIGFMGYPYLAALVQRPEYRIPCEVLAEEMTREWIKLTATGDDKTDRIKKIEAKIKEHKVQEVFRDALTMDNYFGLAPIQIDLGTNADDREMLAPLMIRPEKIGIGELKGFKVIDPTWISPNNYNSTDPLLDNYYKPTTWFVMGREISTTRLLMICSRPVPDLLKPAYNFGGTALSQMLKPYVDNWLRTRQSVSDLLHSFTTYVISTNLQAAVQDNGPTGLLNRLALFFRFRDNRNALVLDKDSETLANISAPLGSLDKLQAQSQEHMSAITRIPLVKAFGITPTGLNATSEGEIRVFYDTIKAMQQRIMTDPLTTVLKIIQLDMDGKIDDTLGIEYVPLYQLDAAGQAAVQKQHADADAVLIESNVITNEESRKRIAADPESPYFGLQGEAPEPPMPEMPGEGSGEGSETGAGGPKPSFRDPSTGIAAGGARGSLSGANSPD